MRRTLLALPLALLAGALPRLGGARADDEERPPEATPVRLDAPLAAGPMLAYATPTSTAVWIQTRRAAKVQLRYYPEGQPLAARLTPPAKTGKAEDHCHAFRLDGLRPDTRYRYELYVDGGLVPRPYPLSFATRSVTMPAGADLTLLIGSCAYINDPTGGDRPGRPYGGEFEVFEAMARQQADACIWLGDNTYLRGADYQTPAGISARYRHDRAWPELQRLLAVTNHYAIWDDHDFGPNDSDGTFRFKDTALAVFQRYWPGLGYGLPGTPGVFRKVSIGDVDLFLLDGRYHRTPNHAPEGPEKRMYGAAQLEWLKQSLVASRASFKLVCGGSQFLNDASPYEGLHRFKAEREELLDWIERARVWGVVFVSGDRHHSELLRFQRPGLYPLTEITSSPLTSGTWKLKPGDPEYENPRRVSGTLVEARNFGVLTVSGTARQRVLGIEARDAKGQRLWRHELRQRDLVLPARRGKLY